MALCVCGGENFSFSFLFFLVAMEPLCGPLPAEAICCATAIIIANCERSEKKGNNNNNMHRLVVAVMVTMGTRWRVRGQVQPISG